MRFMILVKATRDTEAGRFPDGAEALFDAMAAYHDELTKSGVLLDASGLQPSSAGWKVKYAGDKRAVVDGPFTEAKELIAGYTLIQTKTREEALEWTRRFPKPHLDYECEIEVRQLYELDDFATIDAAKDAIGKFREMETQIRK
ncbi:MAG TPA: YciI family protein [Candidatus Cybelea sp.]|nr:YciI family protein [Candidatus Cybelea sp.]